MCLNFLKYLQAKNASKFSLQKSWINFVQKFIELKKHHHQFDLSTAKISLSVGIIIGHQNKTKLIWNFFFYMERKINLASFQYSSCRGHACLNVYRENQRASRHVQNLSRGLPKSLWAQGTIRGLGDKKNPLKLFWLPFIYFWRLWVIELAWHVFENYCLSS